MVLTLAFRVRGHGLCLPPEIILSCSSLPCPQEGLHSPTYCSLPLPEWATLKSINCVIIQQIYLVRTV